MKRWALVTVVLYVALLAALTIPVTCLAIAAGRGGWDAKGILDSFSDDWRTQVGWSVFLGFFALAQLALLVVPVRQARNRPVTKRWVFWPFLAALVLTLVMVSGVFLAAWETLVNSPVPEYWRPNSVLSVPALVVAGAVLGLWTMWTVLFARFAWKREPRTLMGRIVRWLVAGSILELLVAVPTHIVARERNYCCAGTNTFVGLATGIATMLLAFGPAVFALFIRRYWRITGFPVKLVKPDEEAATDSEAQQVSK